MGIGPVPAITNALKVAGLSLNDMDLIEVGLSMELYFVYILLIL